MLISKKCVVKSSKIYSNLGYDISEKYIEVNISDVPLGSSVVVVAKCDFCDNEKEIKYKDYNKNISNGKKFACSLNCGVLKSKENNLLKYGVENHLQSEEVKNKIKKTIFDKYGVNHISNVKDVSDKKRKSMLDVSNEVSIKMKNFYNNISDEKQREINEKRKKTVLEKYSVENISQLSFIKDKVKETVSEKYGGFTLESETLLNKVKNTNLEKYGVTFSIVTDIVKNKIKKTNLEKYGFESPLSSDEIKNKIKKTYLDRYGVSNPMLVPEFVKILSEKFKNKYGTDSYFKTDEFKNSDKYNPIGNDNFRGSLIINNHPDFIEYIGKNISKFKCKNSHEFVIDSITFHNRIRSSEYLCTVCYPIGNSSSIKEQELCDFIKSIYSGEVIKSYRDGIEIDIYLPDMNIGFEFNGLYWHSEIYKDKNYHLNKTNYFKERGIRIIHIWEDDWDLKSDIIKSQVSNWIGITKNRIFARKCVIKEICDSSHKHFLNQNHIQGYVRSSVKIGLYFKDELVSVMTFDKSEGRKKMKEDEWNLNRFCNKLNMNVVGGASKMLLYFIKNYKPKRIISYADKDWSNGNLYEKLGFELVSEIEPNYKYIDKNIRINKQRFTKDKLSKIGYSNLRESDVCKNMGLFKIYNCGHMKFELINK